MPELKIPCDNLDEALGFFTQRLGFRLEMIFPAEDPSVALISGHGSTIRLERSVPPAAGAADIARTPIISRAGEAEWVTGRAGMEYRELIPGKLDGKLTASLIRLGAGGPVQDCVHYHKLDFQMIYCRSGRVRVVYEDQGPPFWLEPGDCVLQPPGIRHRVLESTPQAEVIELASPAMHETWVDHDMELPTARLLPDRDFGGQRFLHSKAIDATVTAAGFGQLEARDLGLAAPGGATARVVELRAAGDGSIWSSDGSNELSTFLFLLTGGVEIAVGEAPPETLTPADSALIPPHTDSHLSATPGSRLLRVDI